MECKKSVSDFGTADREKDWEIARASMWKRGDEKEQEGLFQGRQSPPSLGSQRDAIVNENASVGTWRGRGKGVQNGLRGKKLIKIDIGILTETVIVIVIETIIEMVIEAIEIIKTFIETIIEIVIDTDIENIIDIIIEVIIHFVAIWIITYARSDNIDNGILE